MTYAASRFATRAAWSPPFKPVTDKCEALMEEKRRWGHLLGEIFTRTSLRTQGTIGDLLGRTHREEDAPERRGAVEITNAPRDATEEQRRCILIKIAYQTRGALLFIILVPVAWHLFWRTHMLIAGRSRGRDRTMHGK